MKEERITYFDTYRFIAAMMIFLSHYISCFSKVSFRYFHMLPYSIILEPVRGSLGVQMLCVILGYFAYKKAEDSKESLVTLSVKRYSYFVVMATAYYVIAMAAGWLSFDGGVAHSAKALIRESVLLRDTYNGLFWTLVPMLIGSMFCYVLGRVHMKTGGICVVACALLLLKNPWVFNCVLGCFVVVWQDDKQVRRVMGHWYIQLASIIVTFCTIRTDHESNRLYVLQGIFCVVVLMATMNNEKLSKIMGAPTWSKINRSYFCLFIFHSVFLHHLGKKIMHMDGMMPYKQRFILVFLLLTLIMIVLSKPFNMAVGLIMKYVYKTIDKTEERFRSCMASVYK